jgi:outer membrane autotransporter protein
VETTSASLAYVHGFDGLNLGVVVTAVDSEVDTTGTDINPNVALESEGDGWLVTLGAAKQWERFSLVLTGTMGELSFDSDREDGNFNTKTSDYDVTLYQIELLALYALLQNEGYTLNAFAKLGYAQVENDSIEESNSPDAVTIDDYEDERPYAELGLTGECLSLGAFVPYVSLSVWQDLGDDEVELEGTDAATNAFAFETPDAAETVIKAELGFAYTVSKALRLGAGVGYFEGDKIDGMNASLFGSWSF